MAQIEGNVKVNVNANQAIRELDKLEQKASELRQEIIKTSKQDIIDKKKIRTLEKELKSVEKKQKDLRRATFSYKQVLNNLSGASLNNLNKAYRQLSFEVNRLDRNTVEWKQKMEQLGKIKAEITSVRQKMRGLSETTKKSRSGIGRFADSFNRFGSVAFTAITGITASITGLIMVLRKLMNTISEFEDSFTDVLTLLDADQIEKYSDALENVAVNAMTKFGMEAEKVNKTLFDLVSAGVEVENVGDVMDAAGVLAVAGLTDISTAADGLTSVLNAYKLSSEEATNVANAFFTAQKYGKTTVEELSNSVGKIAPLMSQAGVSYQETLSAMAELTKNGISTAEATTYLKSAMASLIKPSKEAEQVLRQYGVPVGATEIKTAGFSETLLKLNEVIQQNPDAIAKAIPSVEGLTGVLSLSGESLEDFANILEQVNNDLGEGSSMMQAYETKANTLAFKRKQAQQEFNAAILELKDEILPATINILSNITNYTKELTKFIIKYKDEIKAVAKFVLWFYKTTAFIPKIYRMFKSLNKLYNETVESLKKLTQRIKLFFANFKLGILEKTLSLFTKFRKSIFNLSENLKSFQERYSDFINKKAKENSRFAKYISWITTPLENLVNWFKKSLGYIEEFEQKINGLIGKTSKNVKELQPKANLMSSERTTESTIQGRLSATFGRKMQPTTDNNENDLTSPELPDIDDILDNDKKLKAELKNNEKELTDYINNLRNQLFLDEEQRKIKELELWKQKEEEKINAWIASEEQKNEALELLNRQYQKKLADIETTYNKQRMQQYQEVIDFLHQQELKLHGTRKQLMQEDIANISKMYSEKIALAEENALKEDEFAQIWAEKAEQLRQQREEAIRQYKLQKEQEYQEELYNIRQQYGLVSEEEQKQRELDQLEALHQQGLLSEKDYLAAKQKILNKYNNQEYAAAKDLEERKKQLKQEAINNSMQVLDAFGNYFAAMKQQELEDAGDNEKAKKEIMKRYADIEMGITIAKIIASTALAVMRAMELGMPAGPIAAMFVSGAGMTQVAMAINQRDRIKGMAEGGQWVVREQDNKNFYAQPTSKRGIISKPSILVAEEGPEYVIPNEGLQNPVIFSIVSMLETARISGKLKQFRMPRLEGFAEGGATKELQIQAENTNDKLAQRLDALILEFRAFKNEITNWQTQLRVDYWSFKSADEKITKIETNAKL